MPDDNMWHGANITATKGGGGGEGQWAPGQGAPPQNQ